MKTLVSLWQPQKLMADEVKTLCWVTKSEKFRTYRTSLPYCPVSVVHWRAGFEPANQSDI